MIPDDLRAARQILIDAGMSDGEADDLVWLAERENRPLPRDLGGRRTPSLRRSGGSVTWARPYQKRGKKSWRITVHWKGEREIKTVHSEPGAKALVQYIHKQELAGINVIEAIRKAREAAAPEAPTYPRLRDAISTWIEAQESAGAIRPSTSRMYRGRCERWLYPHALPDGRHLGDLPINLVTREMLGAVIQAIKSAGRSMSLVKGVRNPVRSYYANLIETKTFPGPNPAGDLAFFLKGVKRPTKITAFFTQEEGPKLVEAAKALYPRWSVFILTGLLAGLRWGESAGLYKSDIDFKRGRIHVQRTVSEGRRIAPPKDAETRWVKASPALLEALRAHVEKIGLEGRSRTGRRSNVSSSSPTRSAASPATPSSPRRSGSRFWRRRSSRIAAITPPGTPSRPGY